ncbi:hypothetical protein HJG53_04305 [Sphingomonas sp. ID1715]|uniref:CBU_0592 family membrane protein n=1 Tax=Sphingomonas sp. ID1715 TaxID=1656898 RepID=UPI001489B1D4|nr:hypothetical protein [Sphingomonas sp. ID1715]
MIVAIEIIGWIGAGLILLAYLLLSAGRIPARSVIYQALNLLGAIAFVINSGWNGAIPSAALNVVWAGIAIFALVRMAQVKA